jgi:hypothetical protein
MVINKVPLLRYIKNQRKLQPVISAEKIAIVSCGLLIGLFAIPLLVVIQVVAAIFGGMFIVFQLLFGQGLFNEDDQL